MNEQVSTHSRPKAAGVIPVERNHSRHVSTHSRPKAAGKKMRILALFDDGFQHTAARRRLAAVSVFLAL